MEYQMKTIACVVALSMCIASAFGQKPTFKMPDQDPISVLCRQLNGSSASAVSSCIEETKKQGPRSEEDATERLRYRSGGEKSKDQSNEFIRRQLAMDASRGYKNMMIETYAQESGSLRSGTKIAVAGQLRTASVISDFSGQYIGYVSINQANVKVRQKILSILQSQVGVQGGPTPVVLMGRMGTCQHIVMDVDAGRVPCLGVEDAWSMYDSPGTWSFDQMRTMQPIRDAIER
jgi:hypothetical protein